MRRFHLTLATLTPCHVGSGNIFIRNQDFIVRDDELGIIDPRKVYNILTDKGMDAWCNLIEQQGTQSKSIFDLCRGRNPKLRLSDISLRTMALYCQSSGVKELSEQLFSGGAPCIPGSSIKGAIVTALLASGIRPGQWAYDKRPRYDIGQFFSNGRPQNSLLRFLRVGDACFDAIPTIALHCQNLNIRKTNDSLIDAKASQYIECIYADDAASFTLDLIDPSSDLFSQSAREMPRLAEPLSTALHNPQELLQLLNRHTMSLLNEERSFWESYKAGELDDDFPIDDCVDDYIAQIEEQISACNDCDKTNRSSNSQATAILRIGYGGGWSFLTGAWARRQLADNPNSWQMLLKEVRHDRNDRYSEYPYIKSRRIGYDGEVILPLGFVKISYC